MRATQSFRRSSHCGRPRVRPTWLEAAQKTEINSGQVDRVLHAARTWRHRLQSEAEQTSAIGTLMDRVELKFDGIKVSIMLPIAGAEKAQAQLPNHVAIARSFSMQLKRRGVELRLIVGDHNRSAAIVQRACSFEAPASGPIRHLHEHPGQPYTRAVCALPRRMPQT